jgi:transposase
MVSRASSQEVTVYREVHVVEVSELLRQWSVGESVRAMARRLGLDRKTVRRYVEATVAAGGKPGEAVNEALIGEVIARVHARGPGAHGESWAACEAHRELLKEWVEAELPLSKVKDLLQRHSGATVPYRTLHRFAAREFGLGRRRVTVRVAEGKPGEELQVDFGAVGWITEGGRRRRVWALVFTAAVSRHQFVWLTYRQRVEDVIAGCEAAWRFFGGVFRVLIPDNLKAVVTKADALSPGLNETFLEYAQARGLLIDPARVRRPQDKGRVERGVLYVQTSFFAGESFGSLEQAQQAAEPWCRVVAGERVHGTTRRRPIEHFEEVERAALLVAPGQMYEVPQWCEARVQRDHHITAARSLYSLPTAYIGEHVKVRVTRDVVRIYHRGQVIKTHRRVEAGQRQTDPQDYPAGVRDLACRDQQALLTQASQAGTAIGIYAGRLLAGPLPWSRMRHVYRLLGLVRRFGAAAVEPACQRALDADVVDVTRVTRMVAAALEQVPCAPQPPRVASARPPRFSRDAAEYRLGQGGGDE